jgi:hypothetical protein
MTMRSPGKMKTTITNFLLSVSLFTNLQPVLAGVPPVNGTEIDIVFPRVGGHYAETPQGLPVVVALQNPKIAYQYGWQVSWRVFTLPRKEKQHSVEHGTLSGKIDTHLKDKNNPEDVVFDIGHTQSKLPPGNYELVWEIQTGSHCKEADHKANEFVRNPIASSGSLSFVIATDAPTPTMIGVTGCPTAAAVLSFAHMTHTSGLGKKRGLLHWTSSCGVTAAVTHTADPCRITPDVKLQSSIYSVMKWPIPAVVTTTTGQTTHTDKPSTVTTPATSTTSTSASKNGTAPTTTAAKTGGSTSLSSQFGTSLIALTLLASFHTWLMF